MAGSHTGGLQAAKTNKMKFGMDFYQKIGSQGGKAGKGHTFAHGKITPSEAGKLGGRPRKDG